MALALGEWPACGILVWPWDSLWLPSGTLQEFWKSWGEALLAWGLPCLSRPGPGPCSSKTCQVCGRVLARPICESGTSALQGP